MRRIIISKDIPVGQLENKFCKIPCKYLLFYDKLPTGVMAPITLEVLESFGLKGNQKIQPNRMKISSVFWDAGEEVVLNCLGSDTKTLRITWTHNSKVLPKRRIGRISRGRILYNREGGL